jgi:hypothetical protein
MTDDTLSNPFSASDAAWAKALGDYRGATFRFHTEVARAAATGEDIDQTAADAHAFAAVALIGIPATRVVQIGQKIRAADNLVNLGQLYPNLAEILLSDVLGLIGIADGEERLLPHRLH